MIKHLFGMLSAIKVRKNVIPPTSSIPDEANRLVNMDQIYLYQQWNGDDISYVQQANVIEKNVLNDAMFYKIDQIFQDINLVNNDPVSEKEITQLHQTIQETCNKEAALFLQTLLTK